MRIKKLIAIATSALLLLTLLLSCGLLSIRADHDCYDPDNCAICSELKECRQLLRELSSAAPKQKEEHRLVFRSEDRTAPLSLRTPSVRSRTLVALKVKLTA